MAVFCCVVAILVGKVKTKFIVVLTREKLVSVFKNFFVFSRGILSSRVKSILKEYVAFLIKDLKR